MIKAQNGARSHALNHSGGGGDFSVSDTGGSEKRTGIH